MITTLRKLIFGTLAATPALLFSFSSGPPQGRVGNAADGGITCTACHRGGSVNDGRGKVTITTTSYTPGVRQKVMVRLEHPDAQRWGFQLTARLESDQTQKAGAFTAVENLYRVRCGLTGEQDAPCATSVEFAEHVQASTNAGTSGGRTWEVDWMPPDTNVGPVVFYAAGNAANNSSTPVGDFIYNTTLSIAPAVPASTRPTISSGGVVDAFNFSAANGIASHQWVAIAGGNLSTLPGAGRTWDNSIQSGAILPTSLGGVSVKINNRNAAIFFVSPTQLNVLAPLDESTGDVTVVVTTAGGDSTPFTIKKAGAAPAFYTPFAQNNRLFVTAVALDGTYVGKMGPGLDTRVTRAAKPGEVIQVFASGFGPTNPQVGADQLFTGTPELMTKPTIRLGEAAVTFEGNGNLISPGLYQFNITVPAGLAAGDYALVATAGGVSSASTVFLSVAP